MLRIDCEHPTVETQCVLRKSSAIVYKDHTPDFYWVHRMIMSLTINPDQDSDRLKDHPCIFSLTRCYMYPKTKSNANIIITLKEVFLKSILIIISNINIYLIARGQCNNYFLCMIIKTLIISLIIFNF